MNRRELFKKASAIAAAGFTVGMSLEAKADALEHAMIEQLDYQIPEPAAFCDVNWPKPMPNFGEMTKETRPNLMHYDPRLPEMPQRPTLVDFFKLRWAPSLHVLQSANIALEKDLDEKVILACLLHDIAVGGFIRTDHGYWAAQLLGPYVDEEVAWAIRAHQVLRFFPDESVGYEYPQAYIKYFGEDYRPPDYIQDAYQIARNHKWYMTSRLITLNDLYAFEPGVHPEIDQFEDIIGRNFDQPKEGLGFDGSPVAHMWRSMIWPNNFLQAVDQTAHQGGYSSCGSKYFDLDRHVRQYDSMSVVASASQADDVPSADIAAVKIPGSSHSPATREGPEWVISGRSTSYQFNGR